jgi:acetamidase/formamidase
MSHLRQGCRNLVHAFRHPQQRSHGIAQRHRLDQALECWDESQIVLANRAATTTGTASLSLRQWLCIKIPLAAIDRRAGEPGDFRDDHQTASSRGPRLRRREQAPAPLAEQRAYRVPSQLNGGLVDHETDLRRFVKNWNPQNLSQSAAYSPDRDSVIVRSVLSLRQDWGYNLIRPLAGTLPDDFHEARLINIPLDRERMVGRLPWGLDLPLKPFFGVMGVAPPPAWGRITSLIPRAMGGNLDNKELTPGAKLHLPVFVPGALFSCGDGHGVQGDGEVCVTAIETALQGRFRLTLRADLRLDYPRAETPSHYMTMAMDPDLDQCVVRALRDMIVLIGEKRNLSREDAYTLCSLAADLRVTQTVNGSKGIHCMIAKTAVHG